MAVYRVGADGEFRRYLTVALAGGDQAQDLHLPLRETVWIGEGRMPLAGMLPNGPVALSPPTGRAGEAKGLADQILRPPLADSE